MAAALIDVWRHGNGARLAKILTPANAADYIPWVLGPDGSEYVAIDGWLTGEPNTEAIVVHALHGCSACFLQPLLDVLLVKKAYPASVAFELKAKRY